MSGPRDVPMWLRYWEGETSLVKSVAHDPGQLYLPVGGCVRVRDSLGYKMPDKCSWLAHPTYVIPEHVEKLKEITRTHYKGWALCVGEAIPETMFRRGWTDRAYRYSSHPLVKWYLPGMIKVWYTLNDFSEAYESFKVQKSIPVCPTCTLEEYDEPKFRHVWDACMSAFIHEWLYGQSGGRKDDEY